MKEIGCIPVLMMVLICLSVQAQPRPPEPRLHFGTGFFLEGERHLTAGASFRHYLGNRGWALEPEYSFMTEGSHQDHMVILNVVKDLARPSDKVVPYMIFGAGANFYRSRPYLIKSSGIAWGGLGWGMGAKVWLHDRFFIGPQFRIGHEPNLRFSIYVGFGKRPSRSTGRDEP